MEGKGYVINGYNKVITPKFKFHGGKGAFDINQIGAFDIYFSEFDENISITKPTICAKNIIFGGLYADLDGLIIGLNHKTGEKV